MASFTEKCNTGPMHSNEGLRGTTAYHDGIPAPVHHFAVNGPLGLILFNAAK